ncbi:MAG: hypothetical protein E6R03_14020 [Hyphomicrobiaceae bacterium]|nr:MAG: hypothetical protein E6R03_14020 [Hyphomicrobiaceae bacterium]
MTFTHAILKNNQPIPCTLPYPLAGVLRGGEQIVTRYTPARMRQLLDCQPGPAPDARELQIISAPGVPSESAISGKSIPRDFFSGSVSTTGAVTSSIVWKVPAGAGDGTTLRATNLLPGSYSGFLTLLGSSVGAAGVSAYRRLITFQILADGTLDSSNATASTVGTDVEVDAGTDITLSFDTTYFRVQATGAAGTTYNWIATFDLSVVQGS